MVGKAPDVPLVVPSLFREAEPSSRLRFGGCFAAEERLRRWPDEAEKEFGEARVKASNEMWRLRGMNKTAAGGL